MSWERKIVRDTWNMLMLSVRRHVQDKDTRDHFSMGQGVRAQGKKATRLAPRECSKGSLIET